jgi:hypothetical protein
MEEHSATIAGSWGRSRELSENLRAAARNCSLRLWPARAARRAATIQQPLPCSALAPCTHLGHLTIFRSTLLRLRAFAPLVDSAAVRRTRC